MALYRGIDIRTFVERHNRIVQALREIPRELRTRLVLLLAMWNDYVEGLPRLVRVALMLVGFDINQ